MLDWKEAGLKSPSYIDVSEPLSISFTEFIGEQPIGRLTLRDVKRLIEKYNKYHQE